MTNEEFQVQMNRRDFHDFLNKTTRIMERALDNDFDVAGDFFKIDDEESALHKAGKREKLT